MMILKSLPKREGFFYALTFLIKISWVCIIAYEEDEVCTNC